MLNPWHQFLEIPKQPMEVDDLYHVFNSANISSVVYWQWMFKKIQHVGFDSIVECGVGRGRSLLILATIDELESKLKNEATHNIIGFDSFKGFPEPTKYDASWRNPNKGEWSTSPSGKYDYSTEFILNIFSKAGVNPDKLRLESGYFRDSLKAKKASLGRIGILHIDADLYESVKESLEALSDCIVSGGIIVIDDYIESLSQNEAWPGCRRATEEFLEVHHEFRKELSPRGNPILIRV